MRFLFIVFVTSLISFNVFADQECSKNVNKIQLHYINGMFNNKMEFESNKWALERFQKNHLYMYERAGVVTGTHNSDEFVLKQLYEVIKHKAEEYAFDDFYKKTVIVVMLGWLERYAAYGSYFYQNHLGEHFDVSVLGIKSERNYRKMKSDLKSTLDNCHATILVTHSQGNFYGNELYTDISGEYKYLDEFPLNETPMLGYIGIANPTSQVGGQFGADNPEIAKTYTNENDKLMNHVRLSFGAVEAEAYSGSILKDRNAHSLQHSYLQSPEVSEVIADMMIDIAENLTPFPIFEQNLFSMYCPDNGSRLCCMAGYSEITRHFDVAIYDGRVGRFEDVPPYIVEKFYSSEKYKNSSYELYKLLRPYTEVYEPNFDRYFLESFFSMLGLLESAE